MSRRVWISSKGDLRDKMELFRKRARLAGLKITPQRVAIYNELIKSTKHPSAEKLYRKVKKVFPDISLDTVNRTLLTLSEMGAAFVVEGSGEPKRFDGNMETHQHFKCVKCKKIIDFHHRPFDNIELPLEIEKRFTVLRKTVYLEGICDSCRKKSTA
jgi:Fur family peroxide stress response transcriptional regulator